MCIRDSPEGEQWVMALYCVGQTVAVISNVTGRSEDGIKLTIDRYEKCTSMLSDGAKSMLNQRMIWNAMSSYISVVTDSKAIEKLSADKAMKILQELPNTLRELMKIEQEYFTHKEEMNKLNFDGFSKTLPSRAIVPELEA